MESEERERSLRRRKEKLREGRRKRGKREDLKVRK